MGYQYQFLSVIPLLWVGCIRVTHPSAGRRQLKQASISLPLDLHVLSLPLAFILSQDQTLHCIKCFVLNLQLKSQRYCLKSLSCESGKTNSCSNTSKNAVQYIAIKNNSCFFVGSDHLTFASTQPPFLKWESGVKLSVIFRTTKSFRKIFFRIFFRTFIASFQTCCLIGSGCKGKANFRISKRFRNFFQNFSEPFPAPRRSVFLSKRVQR